MANIISEDVKLEFNSEIMEDQLLGRVPMLNVHSWIVKVDDKPTAKPTKPEPTSTSRGQGEGWRVGKGYLPSTTTTVATTTAKIPGQSPTSMDQGGGRRVGGGVPTIPNKNQGR